jgi:hypothetical protein
MIDEKFSAKQELVEIIIQKWWKMHKYSFICRKYILHFSICSHINITRARTDGSSSPDISPGIFNKDAPDFESFSAGVVTVVFEVDGKAAVDEFEAVPVKACSTPKYAGFLVTLAVIISPEPVPGKVDGIHEYCSEC